MSPMKHSLEWLKWYSHLTTQMKPSTLPPKPFKKRTISSLSFTQLYQIIYKIFLPTYNNEYPIVKTKRDGEIYLNNGK